MRKVIKGKLYDTETAVKVGEWSNEYGIRDFQYCAETLYRKRTGEYFIHGEGNAMSKYRQSCGQNQWSGGEAIKPLGYDEAREWAEDHLEADEYEAEFGIPEEGAEHDLHVIISEAAWQALSRAAASEGATVRTVIERLAGTLPASGARGTLRDSYLPAFMDEHNTKSAAEVDFERYLERKIMGN